MSKHAAFFLFDKTGHMAEPWAEAGVECYCVDTQHSIRRERVNGLVHFVWGDARSWTPPPGIRAVFMAAFPVCTNVAVSGARDFATKRGMMLRDALENFEAARLACAWSGAPYMIENPVSYFSSIPHIGKPDYYFHPSDFTGWCADDNYTKKTCLWTGSGFVMLGPFRLEGLPPPDNRIHFASPREDRGDIRSATPRGFARAVFEANKHVIQSLRPVA